MKRGHLKKMDMAVEHKELRMRTVSQLALRTGGARTNTCITLSLYLMFPSPLNLAHFQDFNFGRSQKFNFGCSRNLNFGCYQDFNFDCSQNFNFGYSQDFNFVPKIPSRFLQSCSQDFNSGCSQDFSFGCSQNFNFGCSPDLKFGCSQDVSFGCSEELNFGCSEEWNFACSQEWNFACSQEWNFACPKIPCSCVARLSPFTCCSPIKWCSSSMHVGMTLQHSIPPCLLTCSGSRRLVALLGKTSQRCSFLFLCCVVRVSYSFCWKLKMCHCRRVWDFNSAKETVCLAVIWKCAIVDVCKVFIQLLRFSHAVSWKSVIADVCKVLSL